MILRVAVSSIVAELDHDGLLSGRGPGYTFHLGFVSTELSTLPNHLCQDTRREHSLDLQVGKLIGNCVVVC